VSTARTNLVRIGVAGLLALAACLVVWWPQGAAGSNETTTTPGMSGAVATAAQTSSPTKTPSVTISASPTKTPSVTISAQPTQPPANPGGGSQPTSKPSSRDGGNGGSGHSHNNNGGGGGGKKPPSNNGGSNNNSGGSGSNNNSGGSSTQSTGSSTVVQDDPVVDNTDVEVANPGPSNTQATAPVTDTVPSPAAQVPTAEPTVSTTDDASGASTQTYLTSPEPVETKSAPVWVVPGILLMLTSMLALLGGVLGRGSKPIKVRDDS
jgi:hypothetical protein